jgi:hypothetical protein
MVSLVLYPAVHCSSLRKEELVMGRLGGLSGLLCTQKQAERRFFRFSASYQWIGHVARLAKITLPTVPILPGYREIKSSPSNLKLVSLWFRFHLDPQIKVGTTFYFLESSLFKSGCECDRRSGVLAVGEGILPP